MNAGKKTRKALGDPDHRLSTFYSLKQSSGKTAFVLVWVHCSSRKPPNAPLDGPLFPFAGGSIVDGNSFDQAGNNGDQEGQYNVKATSKATILDKYFLTRRMCTLGLHLEHTLGHPQTKGRRTSKFASVSAEAGVHMGSSASARQALGQLYRC